MQMEKTAVLIIGGGLAGLTASLLLADHRIPSILVERHAGTSIHPRSRGLNTRSMEIFREFGLEEAIRVAGEPIAASNGLLNATSLTDALKNFQRTEQQQSMNEVMKWMQTLSPTTACRVTQDLLEPVLLSAARERGGDLRFSTAYTELTQDENGVTVTLLERETNTHYQVQAEYIIAADGANSQIRKTLGVATSGQGSLGHMLNILFEADLGELVKNREFSMCLIERPEVRGLFTSINNSNRWVFHISYDAERESASDYSIERCKDLLRQALGLPDIEIKIESILPWECAARVADNFVQGRVLLAGDAAHQMPPWGGQGGNSAIADVHNLVWKLAAITKGQADPALLQSYNDERHPYAIKVTAASAKRAGTNGLIAAKVMKKGQLPGWLMKNKLTLGLMNRIVRKMFFTLSGYSFHYQSQAIVPEKRQKTKNTILNGQPGTRVPHIWLERDGQRISTLDLCHNNTFVLLTGTAAQAWFDAAQEIARAGGINLASYRVGDGGELHANEQNWLASNGIAADGALLLRPDGVVAWRSPQSKTRPDQTLREVFHHMGYHLQPAKAATAHS